MKLRLSINVTSTGARFQLLSTAANPPESTAQNDDPVFCPCALPLDTQPRPSTNISSHLPENEIRNFRVRQDSDADCKWSAHNAAAPLLALRKPGRAWKSAGARPRCFSTIHAAVVFEDDSRAGSFESAACGSFFPRA